MNTHACVSYIRTQLLGGAGVAVCGLRMSPLEAWPAAQGGQRKCAALHTLHAGPALMLSVCFLQLPHSSTQHSRQHGSPCTSSSPMWLLKCGREACTVHFHVLKSVPFSVSLCAGARQLDCCVDAWWQHWQAGGQVQASGACADSGCASAHHGQPHVDLQQ
jgi:hypothetical protein